MSTVRLFYQTTISLMRIAGRKRAGRLYSQGRRVTVVTVRLGYPLRLSLTLQKSEIRRSCPAGDSGDGGDGYVRMPRPVTLRENTPQTLPAGVVFSRLLRLVKPPLRLKKPSRFLQPAFAGCNTLHLASKVVCQTFPLDSLFAGLAPCPPPLPSAAGKGGDGDSVPLV